MDQSGSGKTATGETARAADMEIKKASKTDSSSSDEEEGEEQRKIEEERKKHREERWNRSNEKWERKETEQRERDKEPLQRRLLRAIAETEDLAQNIRGLAETLKTAPEKIQKAIEDDERFVLSGTTVSLNIQLSLCQGHLTEGCHEEQCHSLHICAKYLAELCTDAKCEVGHDIETDHNRRLLRPFDLENVDCRMLKKFLKPDSITPEPCLEYNLSRCNEDVCPRMHICADWVSGDCGACALNHDVLELRCEELLRQANVNLSRSRRELKLHLRKNWVSNIQEISKRKREREEVEKFRQAQVSPAPSSENQDFTVSELERKPTLAQIKQNCKNIDGFIYELPRKKVMEDKKNRLAKYEIGERGSEDGLGKVLMLLGGTGTGKSTIINAMVNYVYGVKWEDDFRFKVIVEEHESGKYENHSQTQWITVYTLHRQPSFAMPFTLTVIDTPGFGQTNGIMADEDLRDQIREFFSNFGNVGVDQLNGIGFVVVDAEARLTTTQKYIFDSMMSVFGRDMEGNIYALVTFANVLSPPVLQTLKEGDIPYRTYYKFNNSAFFNRPDDYDADFVQIFWEMNMKFMHTFFKDFQKSKSVILMLTNKVLLERRRLQTALQDIQPQFIAGLGRLEQLRKELAVLERYGSMFDPNENITYTFKMLKQKRVNLSPDECAMNCLRCDFTCHYPCIENEMETNCEAMGIGMMESAVKHCLVCPDHCPPDQHVKSKYRLELHEEEVTRTIKELRAKYEAAAGKKLTPEGLRKEIAKAFNRESANMMDSTNKARECLQTLNQIALRPVPLGVIEYSDLMIESEWRNGRPSQTQSISYMEVIRAKAVLIQMLNKPDPPSVSDYLNLFIDIEKRLGTSGKVQRIKYLEEAKAKIREAL
ncbi:unnamed protein product [Darwinula stevensoni]|uniref:Uncharacterized protein n=1 Tax=Darwinula stevensoni TaxID=69355 RepID=A0A7R9AFU5_9CRUS|nr:unnamed protein product [Darwinula stevensoni]CAG0903642.1 unnamed protein product [Darwinula stevensoni]